MRSVLTKNFNIPKTISDELIDELSDEHIAEKISKKIFL